VDSPGPSRHHRIFAFLICSLDGFHEGAAGDLTWNSRFIDSEFFDWNLRQNRGVGALVLGRRTYDHFAEFWPSPEAVDQMPRTAAFMNNVPKLVVTRTLETASWSGTTIADGSDLAADLERLRRTGTGDIAIFGSSDLTVTLLEEGLVDELRILVHPILLGQGRHMYPGLSRSLELATTSVTTFRSGNVLLTYQARDLGAP
jgi:dihydrofolate reductase